MITPVAATMNNTSNQLVKSRIEDGRFINSFNPQYKFPNLGRVLIWKITSRDNTRLPSNRKELDKILPVIRHEKPEDLYLTKPGLRFIWIGHASCFVQMNNFRFLVDPIFSERCGMVSFIGPKRFRPPALIINDLPDDLDAIFISHSHYDHLDYPSVKELNKRYGERLTWFCGRGLRQWFLDNHIKNIVELDWWEEYYFSVRKDPFRTLFFVIYIYIYIYIFDFYFRKKK
jgi:N-acyl-phosphatidylethanolamine-hydrolysing phospholipase D